MNTWAPKYASSTLVDWNIRLITPHPSSILDAYIEQRIVDPIILNPKFIKTMNTQFLPNTTNATIPA